MYKVFFNGSTILIGSEMKKSLNNHFLENFKFCDCSVVNQLIREIELTKDPLCYSILNREDNESWNQFRNQFVEIPAAGGLVLNRFGDLLFIKRLGFWDLPKGKIEEKETPEIAAVREVEEECGLSGLKVIRQLDSTFHIYRSPYLQVPKNLVLKETKWFLMTYDGEERPVPQTDEFIEEVAWMSREDIKQVYKNTYLSLRDFLEKSLPVI